MKAGHSTNPKPSPKAPARASAARVAGPSFNESLFLLAAGLWIGLSLVKFGNPVIFRSMIPPPANLAEFIFISWPISWGYILLALVLAAAVRAVQPRWNKSHWPIALLVVWLFWQFLSSARTIDKQLTTPTLIHFVSCVLALFVGYWGLARLRVGASFWVPILVGLFYVLFSGFDQRHGGLEALRKDFYANPNWQVYPAEYIQKIQSTRIFSTFVYPNALAGAILLVFPVCLWKLWDLTGSLPRVARGVMVGLFGYMGLACLYWSGSKGGWLIALCLSAVALLHLQFSRKVKTALVVAGLVLGLTAFFVRYSSYFQRGATSVSARFTYWSAAVQTARENPVLGTGPGTFSVAYKKIKPADAEMARLTHNDYLEQASDSGFVGAITFTGFVLASVVLLYRRAAAMGWGFLLMWLGLLGWAAQALIEFSLYIPGLSWPVFVFFGWLWGLEDKRPEKVTA